MLTTRQAGFLPRSELDELRADQSYIDFIRSCLYANTVLFVGISADDLAVGGHLEQLENLHVDSGTHFWVTPRTDLETDKWAESVGIRVIRYEEGTEHSELGEMLEDLLSFVPPEDDPLGPPIVSRAAAPALERLPAPSELAKRDAETIRHALNNHVKGLLQLGDDANQVYEHFRREYDEAIYRAWYINAQKLPTTLFGYTIDSVVAKGAFGTVYKATDQGGRPLAIKVLLEEIRNNDELLKSFRRGVRSMSILSDRAVDGVVTYRDSSEIPAFVVMDWVEGPSLQEAVDARQLQDWYGIIRCSKQLTKIIQDAHELPERVLHRDLRPSNVMLQDFYSDPDGWRVVVLDFDLSWHRGATEKSVVHGSTLFGYLAPEQIVRIPGVSTRHSAVDSFGLGMVLFFVVSRRHPLPAEHRHRVWPETVRAACSARPCDEWRSVPDRMTRLIVNATQDSQAQRWDVAQIQSELRRVWEAVTHPLSVSAPDFLAEEIATRTQVLARHNWSEDEAAATAELPTGLVVRLRGDISGGRLVLGIEWRNTGVHQHRKVGKWLAPAAQNCQAMLRRDGWKVNFETDIQAVRIYAARNAAEASSDIASCAASIDRAIEPLRRI